MDFVMLLCAGIIFVGIISTKLGKFVLLSLTNIAVQWCWISLA